MKATLLECFIRFCETLNVLMIPLVLGAFYMCIPAGWLTCAGLVLGVLLYVVLERRFHYDMHFSQWTPFYKAHKNHHDNPSPESGVPEWWMFVFYFLVSSAVALWNGQFISGLWLGIVLKLFQYEWVHFLCHCPYRFKSRWGQRVRKHHLRHHFVDDTQYLEMLHLPRGFK